jgi:hypothetical protein
MGLNQFIFHFKFVLTLQFKLDNGDYTLQQQKKLGNL